MKDLKYKWDERERWCNFLVSSMMWRCNNFDEFVCFYRAHFHLATMISSLSRDIFACTCSRFFSIGQLSAGVRRCFQWFKLLLWPSSVRSALVRVSLASLLLSSLLTVPRIQSRSTSAIKAVRFLLLLLLLLHCSASVALPLCLPLYLLMLAHTCMPQSLSHWERAKSLMLMRLHVQRYQERQIFIIPVFQRECI